MWKIAPLLVYKGTPATHTHLRTPAPCTTGSDTSTHTCPPPQRSSHGQTSAELTERSLCCCCPIPCSGSSVWQSHHAYGFAGTNLIETEFTQCLSSVGVGKPSPLNTCTWLTPLSAVFDWSLSKTSAACSACLFHTRTQVRMCVCVSSSEACNNQSDGCTRDGTHTMTETATGTAALGCPECQKNIYNCRRSREQMRAWPLKYTKSSRLTMPLRFAHQ